MTIKENNSPVAENVERIMKQRGIKQSYVAAQAGLSSSALCDILKGRRLIKAGEVPRLAKALNVSPNDLYA
ncbi:MAG: helix-turn-helix transcriptional regulator [Lachnospiraceae bacterium]|nr:helix-turn-helix transcriptional regulator [Lachnospiraceae bacterium]